MEVYQPRWEENRAGFSDLDTWTMNVRGPPSDWAVENVTWARNSRGHWA